MDDKGHQQHRHNAPAPALDNPRDGHEDEGGGHAAGVQMSVENIERGAGDGQGKHGADQGNPRPVCARLGKQASRDTPGCIKRQHDGCKLKEQLGGSNGDVREADEVRDPAIEDSGLELETEELGVVGIESGIQIGLDGRKVNAVIFNAGMVAHHGERERCKAQDQQQVDQEFVPLHYQSRILKVRMSSTIIVPSYIQIDGATMDSLTSAGQEKLTLDKLALVIPTLCEAENIGGLLDHVRSVLDPLGIRYEILVVDDDSQDGTEGIVTAIASQDPRVRLLVRQGQRGLSGAVLYGWQNTDASILGVMDADLQHPPELLPQLLACHPDRARPGHRQPLHCRRRPGRVESDSEASFCGRGVGHLADSKSGSCAPKIPCRGSSWCAANAWSGFRFSVRDSSCCWRFWCAAAFSRSKRFRLAFGLRYRGASKANFKVGWDYAQSAARLYAGTIRLRRN